MTMNFSLSLLMRSKMPSKVSKKYKIKETKRDNTANSWFSSQTFGLQIRRKTTLISTKNYLLKMISSIFKANFQKI